MNRFKIIPLILAISANTTLAYANTSCSNQDTYYGKETSLSVSLSTDNKALLEEFLVTGKSGTSFSGVTSSYPLAVNPILGTLLSDGRFIQPSLINLERIQNHLKNNSIDGVINRKIILSGKTIPNSKIQKISDIQTFEYLALSYWKQWLNRIKIQPSQEVDPNNAIQTILNNHAITSAFRCQDSIIFPKSPVIDATVKAFSNYIISKQIDPTQLSAHELFAIGYGHSFEGVNINANNPLVIQAALIYAKENNSPAYNSGTSPLSTINEVLLSYHQAALLSIDLRNNGITISSDKGFYNEAKIVAQTLNQAFIKEKNTPNKPQLFTQLFNVKFHVGTISLPSYESALAIYDAQTNTITVNGNFVNQATRSIESINNYISQATDYVISNFDESEVTNSSEKANEVINRIKNIKFTVGQIVDNPNQLTKAVYDRTNNTVTINKRLFKTDSRSLLQVLTHEAYHAISLQQQANSNIEQLVKDNTKLYLEAHNHTFANVGLSIDPLPSDQIYPIQQESRPRYLINLGGPSDTDALFSIPGDRVDWLGMIFQALFLRSPVKKPSIPSISSLKPSKIGNNILTTVRNPKPVGTVLQPSPGTKPRSIRPPREDQEPLLPEQTISSTTNQKPTRVQDRALAGLADEVAETIVTVANSPNTEFTPLTKIPESVKFEPNFDLIENNPLLEQELAEDEIRSIGELPDGIYQYNGDDYDPTHIIVQDGNSFAANENTYVDSGEITYIIYDAKSTYAGEEGGVTYEVRIDPETGSITSIEPEYPVGAGGSRDGLYPEKAADLYNEFKEGFDKYDRERPYEMLNKVTTDRNNVNQLNFETSESLKLDEKIAKLKGLARNKYNEAINTISLRHYTTVPEGQEPFSELATSFELKLRNKAQGEIFSRDDFIERGNTNTNAKDVALMGNTQFNFFLLTIDETAPRRGFLANKTHFAEIKITQEVSDLLGDVWISKDLIKDIVTPKDYANVKAFKGTLIELKKYVSFVLSKGFASQPNAQLTAIDTHFSGSTEVKVPGNIQQHAGGVDIYTWHTVEAAALTINPQEEEEYQRKPFSEVNTVEEAINYLQYYAIDFEENRVSWWALQIHFATQFSNGYGAASPEADQILNLKFEDSLAISKQLRSE
ncbi:hypothetical protein H0A36_02300 [Endozoicomonas sp. SM1973]|uniref:Uncharacterized protein n=1 Tax=Spartinivicinus marinus TaxID=2994442 RepID=A0A853HSQ6_9GAMM|nr:hypothetical protein [Spartinivicinus marinus]MCX4029936.1 hypothetical protein [Spartinivicinus marinus]NYZ64820.1 hypothetical protein [Spartinivicinus marinus]